MNLQINPNHTANYYKYNNMTFNGFPRRTLRNTGIALMTAAMLTSGSCSNKKYGTDSTNFTKTEISDKFDTKIDTVEKHQAVKNVYHYFPKDDNIITNKPDWSEKRYPDGRVEIDSLEYKISITPDGKRTTVKTETDEQGNITTTTEFPDSTKIVTIDYKTINPSEKLIVEQTYWSNGNLKEHKYYNEYPSDSTNIESNKIIEQNYMKYSENGVLLQWETSQIDPERNKNNNQYDRKGRLTYDDVKNEKYLYKENDTIPYKSISEYDDCKRITLYTDSGKVEKIFFQAIDGTITQ